MNEMEFAVRFFNSIRLDRELDARLTRLARLTGRSKSYYVITESTGAGRLRHWLTFASRKG